MATFVYEPFSGPTITVITYSLLLAMCSLDFPLRVDY